MYYRVLMLIMLAAMSWGSTEEDIAVFVPREIELGTVPGTEASIRECRLETRVDLIVLRAMADCACVKVEAAKQLPTTLKAGESLDLLISVDVTGMAGIVAKKIFVQVQPEEGPTAILQLAVSGMASDADGFDDVVAAATATPPPVATTEVAPGEQLLLFVQPDCDQCGWVRLIWLPAFRKQSPAAAIQVIDVASEEGLRVLLDMEQKLNVASPDNAPAAFWQGKLHYGTEAIADLLSVGPDQVAAPLEE